MKLLTILFAFVLTTSVFAKEEPGGAGAPEMILPKMHALNNAEIQAGNLAIKKACRAEVRQFGQALVADHSANNTQVGELAHSKGVSPRKVYWNETEQQNLNQHEQNMAHLRSMTTCDFDSAFASAMVNAHTFAVSLASSALAEASDEDVKTYLQNTIPKLREHLERAKSLQ
jgi:putative membrane protein